MGSGKLEDRMRILPHFRKPHATDLVLLELDYCEQSVLSNYYELLLGYMKIHIFFFCFPQKNNIIQVRINMRVSKWLQIFYFWLNYPFNSQAVHISLPHLWWCC